MKYFLYILIIIIVFKYTLTLYFTSQCNSIIDEKKDIIERTNYLLDHLKTSPRNILNYIPESLGPQFQGEWALYSCSMLSSALVNISQLYPETRDANIKHIDSLINIVTSYDLRDYDTMRWYEDPLESLSYSNLSHISYLSHLAWMICGYKKIGGCNKYDDLHILKTAEFAGTTFKWGNKRHYLLADVALVGEAIMLAMRTNHNFNNSTSQGQ